MSEVVFLVTGHRKQRDWLGGHAQDQIRGESEVCSEPRCRSQIHKSCPPQAPKLPTFWALYPPFKTTSEPTPLQRIISFGDPRECEPESVRCGVRYFDTSSTIDDPSYDETARSYRSCRMSPNLGESFWCRLESG